MEKSNFIRLDYYITLQVGVTLRVAWYVLGGAWPLGHSCSNTTVYRRISHKLSFMNKAFTDLDVGAVAVVMMVVAAYFFLAKN